MYHRIVRSMLAVFTVAALLAACGSEGPESHRPAGDTTTSTPSESDGSSPAPDAVADDTSTSAAPDTARDPNAADTSAREAVAEATGQRYNVKSGVIELKSTLMEGMRQTVYFDDYGAKEAIYANIEAGGTTNRTVMVMADGSNVIYDPVKKVGTRVDLTDALSQLGLGGIPNLSSLTEEAKRELRYQPVAGRTVLGKTTEGASITAMGTPLKVWTWQGVPLRMEASMNGQQITVEATSLKTDLTVPAERFAIPKDVRLQELKTGR
jgi:hypothetical protein